jgi:2-oxoglutarate ferredoxin oxidoreductase subunit alpha
MAVFPRIFGQPVPAREVVEELEEATVRFAGDAGDGMQLVSARFAAASRQSGNVVGTLPEPPAEIRAYAGTLANVCSFQVHISRRMEHTPGDVLHTLVALNPAALRANLDDLAPGGNLIVNTDGFTAKDLEAAGYAGNPLLDGSLQRFRLVSLPIDQLNLEAVREVNLSPREAQRCRNFYLLGFVCWLYERPLEPTLRWVREKYEKNPVLIEANSRALEAGHQQAQQERATRYRIGKAEMPPGRYRTITGTEALTAGVLTAAQLTGLPLVFSCFPVTPANELLHRLCEYPQSHVKLIQAEDELAALQFALGASFGGALGVAASSGPGLSLQGEALGLAVMSELPCVLIGMQRAGPATGMPSKVEQADLLQSLYGRPGECPLIVLAAATPSDGFSLFLDAVRLAVRYMTPVILLTDGYLARAAETWRVPAVADLPPLDVPQAARRGGDSAFLPYQRDERLARLWAPPGTAGFEHRTGGLEKENLTGNVSFEPLNHEAMVRTRALKIANAADEIPLLSVSAAEPADLLVLGWGSTLAAIQSAVRRCRGRGMPVVSAHLRHLHPLPKNTAEVLRRYGRVLIPELNAGQLRQVLRAACGVDAIGLNKIQGRPFLVSEIEREIETIFKLQISDCRLQI